MLITADLGPAGLIKCSGVLIAPTIVVTTLSCATFPSNITLSDITPSGPGEVPPLASAGRRSFPTAVDYATACEPDAGWTPREDGSFPALVPAPLDEARLTVSIRQGGMDVGISGVRRIVHPRAQSRCFDAVAALILARPLTVGRLPIRVWDTSAVGEAVVLSGFERNQPEPYELDSSIDDVTFEAPSDDAPPRSLSIVNQVCYFEFGGAVVSRETGALVGIIASATGMSCGDPEGRTIATRVAPFARMLGEVAESAGETLWVEAAREATSILPAPCP